MKKIRTCARGFTLMELLIVIALLAALSTLLLPSFTADRDAGNAAIIKSEMYEIQRSFVRFYNDCGRDPGGLSGFAWTNVYLAPLIRRTDTNSPALYGYTPWTLERNIGWRGPYAEGEGYYINAASNRYPALLDPYGDPYEVVYEPDEHGATNLFLYPSDATCDLVDQSRDDLKRQLTFDE
jgi:prepilin-type N-terminal cleavage/methylation domain-containing protein